MRAKLIIFTWIFSINFSVFAYEMYIPFPAELSGGSVALEKWIKDRHLELPSSIEKLTNSGQGEILVVYYSSGSGMPLLDVYVYACSKTICTLLGVRRSIQINPQVDKPIEAHLLPDESEFILRTHDGVVHIRLALDELTKNH